MLPQCCPGSQRAKQGQQCNYPSHNLLLNSPALLCRMEFAPAWFTRSATANGCFSRNRFIMKIGMYLKKLESDLPMPGHDQSFSSVSSILIKFGSDFLMYSERIRRSSSVIP